MNVAKPHWKKNIITFKLYYAHKGQLFFITTESINSYAT